MTRYFLQIELTDEELGDLEYAFQEAIDNGGGSGVDPIGARLCALRDKVQGATAAKDEAARIEKRVGVEL